MKFTVKTSRKYWGVDMFGRRIGIKALDEARTEAGCRFDANLLYHYIADIHEYPQAEVSEEVARKSGHFSECYEVEIKVTLGALNEFVERKLSLRRTNNGEIVNACWEWKFNTEKFLAAWKERGFPLEW